MTMKDEPFGDVAWEEYFRPEGGTITLASGKTCRLIIDVDETDEAAAAAARYTSKFLLANEPLVRHVVAYSTVNCYRDTWFNGEPPTPDDLARKINLHTVEIHDEGVELFYTADQEDDPFAGHWLQVPIDAKGELGEPEIHG